MFMCDVGKFSSLQGSEGRVCVSGVMLARVNVCFSSLCSGSVRGRNNMKKLLLFTTQVGLQSP